ncbi:MAG TPA: type IV toxin-antitoxin system AbiEi family antitoxin domain-containing protein [Ilumatobacter sp.]|nr:type IV toxin-antitoxin system AbiEi family antitoxin domain-containing protein [Ilumatobacter sp.]
MRDVDRALIELAARQHQVFSREQARAAGLSASGVSKRVARGQFVECGPSSLHFPGVTLSYRGCLQAGLLDLGPGALVSAHAAGCVHVLDHFEEGPLEFLTLRDSRHRRTVGSVRSTTDISKLDRAVVDGLACTSVTRTVIELLRMGDTIAAGNALDSGTRLRLTAPEVVARRLAQMGRQGRDGVAAFELLRRLGTVESRLERRFLSVVADAGLPVPALQQRYQLEGVGNVRVDFEFLTFPIVVEVGGSRGYLSRDERRHQERRRTALQLMGKTVYFFTADDVFNDPDYVVRTLFTALTHPQAG